jgi:hypothetical protein
MAEQPESAMSLSAPLRRYLESELRRAPTWMESTLGAAASSLGLPVGFGQRGALGASPADAQRALAQHTPALISAWVASLRRQTGIDQREGSTRPADDLRLATLSLVDEDQAQEDIEVVRAVQLIEHESEWALRELQALTAALAGAEEIRPDSNPLRPEVIARGLRDALQTLPLGGSTRVLVLQHACTPLAAALKQAYGNAVDRLEDQGVEPLAYRTTVRPSLTRTGVPPRVPRSGFDATQPGAFDELIAAMPRAQGRSSRSLAQALAQPAGRRRARLDALMARELGRARSAPTPVNRLREQLDELDQAAEEEDDRVVVTLLVRLFDHLLADPGLRAPVRPVLALLQWSALRAALNDPAMLADPRHATWQLMNLIVGESRGYESDDDPRLAAWLARATRTLDEELQSGKPDTQAHRDALARLREAAQAALNAERDAGADAIARLEELSRRDQLQARYRQRISAQVMDMNLDRSVLDFLVGPWVEVVAAGVVRFGEDSPQAMGLLAVAPALARSVQPLRNDAERQERLRELPALVQRIQNGLALIGWPAEQRQHLLDMLSARHAAMLRQRPMAQGEPSPEEIVRRMREEALEPQASSAGPDSLIDLGSLETVPAPLMPEPQAEPEPVPSWWRHLQPGQWLRAFLRGQWRQLRLLWISRDGRYLLLAGQPGQRFSVALAALERLAGENLAEPLEPRNALERAVDSLFGELRSASPR